MCVRLSEKIVCFMSLISGVYCNKYGTDFGSSPEGNIPGRNVCSPDGYFCTCFYSHGNECAGKFVYILTELFICTHIVQGSVFKCVLVRKFLYHTVKYLRKSQVNQFVFFPYILSGAIVVWIQYFLFATSFFKTTHVVYKMRENDFIIRKVFHPFCFPFQRNKSVIIDRRKCTHHVGNRKSTLSD